MSKKRNKHILNKGVATPSIMEGVANLPIGELANLSKAIPQYLSSKVQKSLNSNNFEEVVKAQLVLDQIKGKNEGLKSIFFDPNNFSDVGKGYKETLYGVSFNILNRMGEIFIVKAIINTRIEQVQNFLRFSIDEQKEGFTIRKKRSVFSVENSEMSPDEKERAEYIVNFLQRGGEVDKWENADTFQDFIRKIIRDSLVLDQLAFEIVRDNNFELLKFKAVDAALIRWLDTVDPKLRTQFEKYRFKGYLPTHAMVWDNQILRNPETNDLIVYYPWELGYGIRNKTTNIYKAGYGVSELETLIEIITWVLWGMQYNGNFFKQGSQPKGFIKVKESNVNNSTLNEFRQAWTQTMMGVQNSHRIPIIQGLDMDWIDLQMSNRDMEFTEWVKFLIVLTCAVYRIDPTELGFNFSDASQLFGQAGQKERLEHSKKKGLKPLLVFIQNIINKYLVEEIDSDFEFVFTGIDVDDDSEQVRNDGEKLKYGMVSFEDMFKKYSGREYQEGVDTILNPIFQQAQQLKMYGGEGMNNIVDTHTGEPDKGVPDPYAEYEKAFGENPIMKSAFDYIQDTLTK